jgi:hypothetical protein
MLVGVTVDIREVAGGGGGVGTAEPLANSQSLGECLCGGGDVVRAVRATSYAYQRTCLLQDGSDGAARPLAWPYSVRGSPARGGQERDRRYCHPRKRRPRYRNK